LVIRAKAMGDVIKNSPNGIKNREILKRKPPQQKKNQISSINTSGHEGGKSRRV